MGNFILIFVEFDDTIAMNLWKKGQLEQFAREQGGDAAAGRTHAPLAT